ncbi:hypothetical protein HW423_08580 [Aerococcaceae bacterium INB8]|uniref:Uncharacterized protein n=1 Tax=Ruoffia halotolerans TaxID=2748684 RepID=A0A839A7R9_9LACT|nr:hypothetical protein [Ruoffia halotolerans]MBA5729840.1 hypothetical protein [Ruoffia halotolerans]
MYEYFSIEDRISLLKDLVAIKSVNGNEIEVDEARANLVAEFGSGSPVIGILNHMDGVS